ncbi:N-6 DNA methylase [Paenibacillus polymyxa]|uniref:Eco57I restriction-modification methylase domain-containing protein n=1 Tax=Paenibacillus polymyxa TaxID=1406 RepID=UPI001BE59478|nr:N-6 DNA methylase [Paenibacillus polymyxa]MBT2285809.1 N-6 DNA methylase [Paenibacillus polymyxa]
MNNKCQVFTPYDVVIGMLDKSSYKDNLYGKKVLENSCGEGNILCVIVERYIQDGLRRGVSVEKIKLGLQSDIYGIEIDEGPYTKCLYNLNETAKRYGIENVAWNLLNVDFLIEGIDLKFDYVIGNPPYISYKDLTVKTREYLKIHFKSCSIGKFDYCYAFLEASINVLKDNGVLIYLVPNSIFKNVFGKNLREILLPYLVRVYDYRTMKLFDVLTSSAIIICNKDSKEEDIEYLDISLNRSHKVKKNDLRLKSKWEFSSNYSGDIENRRIFGDYFNSSITLATLLNSAFVMKNIKTIENDHKYITIDGIKLEKEIIKKAVSPRSLNYNKNEYIIFPYFYFENKLGRYNSEEFETKFPEVKNYLYTFIKDLEKRASDKSVNWFEYGRTQALAHLNQEKLLLSTVVTNCVKVYKVPQDTIPYSGIYITSKGSFSLNAAKRILESEDFYNYVQNIGINANGSSLRITARDVNNYLLPEGWENNG